MDKFYSERAARDPVNVNFCAIALRSHIPVRTPSTAHKTRTGSVTAPKMPRQALSGPTATATKDRHYPKPTGVPVIRRFDQNDHTITIRYVNSSPQGTASDPVVIPAEGEVRVPRVPVWTQPRPWVQFTTDIPGPPNLSIPHPSLQPAPPPEAPQDVTDTHMENVFSTQCTFQVTRK